MEVYCQTSLPGWVGFYERLVGITRRTLMKTLGSWCLTEKQLSTILVEAEAVVNTRPLVYVDEDISSSIVATYTSWFLSLHSEHVIPDVVEDDESDPEYSEKKLCTAQQLLDIWKRGQKCLSQFWSMLSLRERIQRKLCNHGTLAVPRIGQVALIKDNLPKSWWKICKIVELVTGRDQKVRSARVLVSPHKYSNRPQNLLHPIEFPPIEEMMTVMTFVIS